MVKLKALPRWDQQWDCHIYRKSRFEHRFLAAAESLESRETGHGEDLSDKSSKERGVSKEFAK